MRNAQALLPAAEQPRFAAVIQAFVGQEATHRHLHGLFNTQLLRHGLHNQIEHRSLQRLRANAHRDVRVQLAATATAATEHLTALFADWLLRHPEALAGAEPRLQALWLWHSAEESEHRSSAFELHQAVSRRGWRVCNPTTPQTQSLPGTYKVTFASAMPSLINLPLLPLNHFKARGNEASLRIWSEGAN